MMSGIKIFFLLIIFSTLEHLKSSKTCQSLIDGSDYQGFINISISNRTCKSWNTLNDLKINQLENNFCRNPNSSSGVWCYIDDNLVEPCHVPMCPNNPKADYCIPIPKNDNTTCPSLFQHTNFFQGNVSKYYRFCCLKNRMDSNYLPIIDSCLLIFISKENMLPNYSLCPSGFIYKPMFNEILEETSIYKCCRFNQANVSSGHEIFKMVITGNVNKSLPIFGSITNESCRPIREFYSETVEYFDSMSENSYFPYSENKICLYYLDVSINKMTSNSELGLLTTNLCPSGLIQSKEFEVDLLINNMPIKSCWPNSENYLYPSGQYCLLLKRNLKFVSKCPQDFHAYIIRSINGVELVRFCCKMENLTTIIWLEAENKTVLTNVILISIRNECPFMISNITMSSYTVNTTADNLSPTLNKSNNEKKFPGINLCIYEVNRDEFAYIKIGNFCPTGMNESQITFTSVLHWEPDSTNKIFQMYFCVGKSNLKYESFPKGNYCLYKISRICPLGFMSKSIPNTKTIISKSGFVPNYTEDAFCCRDDGNIPMNKFKNHQFPFLNRNDIRSFGLPMFNRKNICPQIEELIDYHDANVDGFYCAYRTFEDNYKWSNEIIFPSLSGNINETYQSRGYWKSLTKFQYTQSVVAVYPNDKFCIVSGEKCSAMKNIDFAMFYPLMGKYLCCSLIKYNLSNSLLPGKYKKFNSVGFVAINGKCPVINEDIYRFENTIDEIFEIEKILFNSSNLFDMIKLGISVDLDSKPQFVRVKFLFCLFTLIKDQILPINSYGFMKPFQFKCPTGFIEKTHTFSVDIKAKFNIISTHFLKSAITSNMVYSSLCFPTSITTNYQALFNSSSLCSFHYNTCPPEFATFAKHLLVRDNNSINNVSLIVCCKKIYKSQNQYYLSSIDIPFSLPIHPESSDCPILRNFNFKKWRLNIKYSDNSEMNSFCFYYRILLPISWPLGSYLTISFNKKCPPYFVLIEHKHSFMCIRNESHTNQMIFPRGSYCLLSYQELHCPLSGIKSWTEIISVDEIPYVICCAQDKEIILNIYIPDERVFGFLSYEKCSVIPGTTVVVEPFSNSNHIVRCIYLSNCSNKLPKNCLKSLVKDSQINVQFYTPVAILTLSLILIFLMSGFIVYLKIKKNNPHSSQTNHFRLEPMYSMTDSSSNRMYSELEDKAISVTYNTLS